MIAPIVRSKVVNDLGVESGKGRWKRMPALFYKSTRAMSIVLLASQHSAVGLYTMDGGSEN